MFTVKALLMQGLWFYRIDFPMELFPKELTYVSYEQGVIAGKRHLTPTEHESTRGLFLMNKAGWRYDLVSYAPENRYLAPRMDINCGRNRLVVSYPKADQSWVQISKEITAGTCPKFALI